YPPLVPSAWSEHLVKEDAAAHIGRDQVEPGPCQHQEDHSGDVRLVPGKKRKDPQGQGALIHAVGTDGPLRLGVEPAAPGAKGRGTTVGKILFPDGFAFSRLFGYFGENAKFARLAIGKLADPAGLTRDRHHEKAVSHQV